MKRVTVYWKDSATSSMWRDEVWYKKYSTPMTCETTGYLLVDKDDYVTIALTHAPGNRDITGSMAIPRGCITRIERLYPKKKTKGGKQ